MNYLLQPPAPPSLPIVGSDLRFPVRRVFCIGRNYAEHAREMGATVERGHPVFFTKPADGVVADGADVPYPSATRELHHEVEMVVALSAGGVALDAAHAANAVYGYAVGLDLTRRDLQAVAKAKGWPWDTAKGFDHSAPISAIRPLASGAPAPDARLTLTVNGELRQAASIATMLWPVPEILAELSRLFELKAGDLVFTGTPAGVGPLQRGDALHAELAGIARLDTRIV